MLKNFAWQREDEPQNMLSYIFMMVNVVYGIACTAFSGTSVMQATPLATAIFPLPVWGCLCFLLVGLTLYGIATHKTLGFTTGIFGVCLWSYGSLLYAISGSWLALFAIYVPQILFWTFWHIGIKRYWDKESKLHPQ